jgi:hypothetical protein
LVRFTSEIGQLLETGSSAGGHHQFIGEARNWVPFPAFPPQQSRAGVKSSGHYPRNPRHAVFHGGKTAKRFGFFTSNFALTALVIAGLSKCRWLAGLFFEWIKQHLRVKAFSGTNENAVKTQIRIAISVHVRAASVKKGLCAGVSISPIPAVSSLALVAKAPLDQVNDQAPHQINEEKPIKLNLFSSLPDRRDTK